MTIRLVSCMNVNFSSDNDYHNNKVGLLYKVSFCSDVDHHDCMVGLLH